MRKRQSLLDALPPFPDTTPPSPPDPPPPQSRSEKIAAHLLARRANPDPVTQDPPPPNPAIANLAAALGKGAGVSGNPIHVTLSEREHLTIGPGPSLTSPQPKVPSPYASSASSSWLV